MGSGLRSCPTGESAESSSKTILMCIHSTAMSVHSRPPIKDRARSAPHLPAPPRLCASALGSSSWPSRPSWFPTNLCGLHDGRARHAVPLRFGRSNRHRAFVVPLSPWRLCVHAPSPAFAAARLCAEVTFIRVERFFMPFVVSSNGRPVAARFRYATLRRLAARSRS